ncbi:hypothetical protein [Streptomyces sp. SCL15-4]|uniref:hypothetical protein n=1 Tax=Streptomyces sp. SCL15-4 TaxID=2967221 RepID=UPI0029670080|nr:hypothetical protein [Streptomyces sp. SCL15-4]
MTMTPAELEARKDTLELLNAEATSRLTRQRAREESVGALARWLGRPSPAVTLGYYAHFVP